MSNLYVKTVADLFGNDYIASLTPYEKCSIKKEMYYILEASDETHVAPNRWSHVDEVPIERLELCIMLDGELYTWIKWSDL